MCVPLIEYEEPEKEKNDERFPGDTEGYREWEKEYYEKNGHVPDYNGEP